MIRFMKMSICERRHGATESSNNKMSLQSDGWIDPKIYVTGRSIISAPT